LVTIVNFCLTGAGFASIEPARASLPHNSICPAEPDVVALSSSDTGEALELLFLSSPRVLASHVLEPSYGFNSDQFEDWPEANDTMVSVYVALTMDVLRFRTSPVNAPHVDQESHADIPSTRRSCSWVTSSRKPHRQKPTAVGDPQRKSKNMKIDVGRALAAPTPCGVFSAVDFDRSE
jgi:hypothetical protein